MGERRFNEEEVAEIFARATEERPEGRRHLASGDGMTLAELQEIGHEVGIAPESIRQAALLLDRSGHATSRHLLGLPIGVGRTVELDRQLTDDEWERLVVDLRETFDARGRVRQHGSLRQWTNGNLQALLEPTATGSRVRLRTVKGDARGLIGGGLAMAGMGAIGLAVALLTGGAAEAGTASMMGMLLAMGSALIGVGAIRLPGWARRRQEQMSGIAERLTLLTKCTADRSGEPPV